MRIAALLLALMVLLGRLPAALAAGADVSPGLQGTVAGYRLSGVEPDGDPLYQVALDTTLSASGSAPGLHLIVNAYMENFKPDTTPILPDLLHPKETATNLGGFLQGKALVTDDAGSPVYTGVFTAEAFLDNSNHMVMTLSGVNAARRGSGSLKGSFTLHSNGSLRGALRGRITLPAAARHQIEAHRGASMPRLETLLKAMTVRPHPMVGRSTSGSSASPLHTGYGQPAAAPHRTPSPLTIAAAAGAVLCFLMAGALWWRQRHAPVA